MNIEIVKKIGVAGAGTMGSGIAQICSMSGFEVVLFDVNSSQLDSAKANIAKNLDGAIKRGKLKAEEKDGIINSIQFSSDVTDLKADIVIEAIVEKLEIKLDLFNTIASQNPDNTILASNTSTIPITRIGKGISHPERVVGMHFFNPVHIMKLVEVISGAATSDEVSETIFAFAHKLGKTAVKAKDAPGFIVNRVARHFYVEALQILEENVTDYESIDELAESIGFRMGPFKLMDLIGVDTNFSVTSSMYELFHQDPKFRPNRIQKQMVDAGFNGKKTGKGFYKY